VINILQSICKECARLLLPDAERVKYLTRLKRRTDPQDRESIRKEIQDSCKKVKYCPQPGCGAYNGTVKKIPGQALKVQHDKFNPKTVPDDVINDFIEEFEYSCQIHQT